MLERIVERAIAAKGFDVDKQLRRHISDTARATLLRLERKGVVRRVLVEPDTWWELARARSC